MPQPATPKHLRKLKNVIFWRQLLCIYFDILQPKPMMFHFLAKTFPILISKHIGAPAPPHFCKAKGGKAFVEEERLMPQPQHLRKLKKVILWRKKIEEKFVKQKVAKPLRRKDLCHNLQRLNTSENWKKLYFEGNSCVAVYLLLPKWSQTFGKWSEWGWHG